jgi:hypothetical protein
MNYENQKGNAYGNPYYNNDNEIRVNNTQPITDYQNGRVIQMFNTPNADYKSFNNDNNDNDNFKNNAVSRIQQVTPLSALYFSKRNMEILQAKIRKAVFDRTNGEHLIGEQSITELEIVMRAIFLQYARYSGDLREQVLQLDKIVVEETVPKIISNIKQYMGYLHDVQQLPIPIDLPKNLSSRGTKMLNSVTSTF